MDALLHAVRERKEALSSSKRLNARVVLSTAALLCFVGGFLAPILGLVIIIIHTAIPGDHALERVGTALMIVSIPLLLLGSHLMDLFERSARNARQ
jgi:hypothetical protein